MILRILEKLYFLLCFFSAEVSADIIDVKSYMQRQADIAIATDPSSCIKAIRPSPFMSSYINLCKSVPAYVAKTTLQTGATNYQNIVVSDVPTSIVPIENLSIPNCTDTPIEFQQTREVSASESATLVKKDVVATTTEIALNGSAEVNLGIVKFGGGHSIKGNKVVTNEEGMTTAVENVKKETITLKTVIQPYTTTNVQIFAQKKLASAEYFGDIFLEATVNKFGTYSILVPNNKLPYRGSVFSDFIDSTTIAYTQMKLPKSACAASPYAQKAQSAQSLTGQSPGESSPKVIDFDKEFLPYGYVQSTPRQITKNIGAGFQLITAPVISAIQVRGKVGGVSPCNIVFSANEQKQKLVLLPGVWSEWTTLKVVAGASVEFISMDSQCRDQVVGEVKYFE